MRPTLSTFLLKTLIWMLCTHSLSYASILTSSSLAPLIEKSIESSKPIIDPVESAIKLKQLKDERNPTITMAENVINNMARLETNLGWSEIHVSKDSPAHGQLIENAIDSTGIQQGKYALIAMKASQNLVTKCLSFTSSKIECAKYLTQLSMADTKLQSACDQIKSNCNIHSNSSKYRTIDGSCNHNDKGNLGRSFTAYRRILFPDYADGIAEPKTRSANKETLPSPRRISVILTKDMNRVDNDLTLAVMQWSQFVLHDLAHTPTSRMLHSGKSVVCCDINGKRLAPRYIHPFCFPIDIPQDDPFYSKYYVNCMSYVRSLPAFNNDCTFGPLNIMNQATHFLDASQIYGSTSKKAMKLREGEGGKLIVSIHDKKTFLPHSLKPVDDCQVKSDKNECYRSGDIRVNMQPHLTAMHVLWHREHNRIAKELHNINPHWDDERLYQEARRIVIAEIQHIAYNEWVEVLLGKKFVDKLNLNEYKENIDPTVSNSFATAAMKFTNSLIDSNLKVYDEMRQSNLSLRLHEHYNRPEAIEKPGTLDGLIRGLATQSCQKYDLDIVKDVTERLYATGNIGFDALSLDIQRGRDHGLPSYIKYRDFCGLSKVNSFDDLSDHISPDIIETLKKLYASPYDIDLLVGGLAEKPFFDSLLGPTFTCLISEQLYRTRLGDKYFYTNENHEWSLTRKQINEIKNVKLATVFCNNGDDIKMMQPHVFHVINEQNKLVPCSSLPQVDLNAWKER